MSAKTLSSIADEYFCNINSLAKRISEDIASTKDAYEGLWNTLSIKERNQAIDETIIQPEIALKYASKKLDNAKDIPDCYPTLRIQTGMKFIIDESGTTLRWKDEHSAPFSFMTQSQMNLDCIDKDATNNERNSKNLSNYIIENPNFIIPSKNGINNDLMEDNYSSPSSQISFYQSETNYSDTIFSTEDCSTQRSNDMDNDNTDGIFTKLMNKTLKLQNTSDDDLEQLMPQKNSKFTKNGNIDKNLMHIHFIGHHTKSNDTESTALLDTPSSFSSYQSSHLNMDQHEIPKTGFEFLDNW